MSIDLGTEHPINISAACRTLVPKYSGSPISPATAYRWVNRGITADDGHRVKLDAVKIGRQLITTREAVARFFAELTRRSTAGSRNEEGGIAVETESNLRAAGILGDVEIKTDDGIGD